MKNIEKSVKKSKKNNIFRTFFNYFNNFLDKHIFPNDIKCIFCGKDIPSFYEKPYCFSCEKEIKLSTRNRCLICDLPINNEAKICDFCKTNHRHFKRVFTPLIYDNIVRKTLISYKKDNKRYLAKGFAVIIYNYIKNYANDFDIITYVPLTKEKRKERSFNQSEYIAKELGKLLNIEVEEFLIKAKVTIEQKTLNFQERKKNLLNSFKLKNIEKLKDKNVLLVDDIITTCATIDECSRVLSKYAKNVYATAPARVEKID